MKLLTVFTCEMDRQFGNQNGDKDHVVLVQTHRDGPANANIILRTGAGPFVLGQVLLTDERFEPGETYEITLTKLPKA